MNNLLRQFLRKGFVIVAIAVYWVLDDLILILPDGVVSSIGGMFFKWTGNSYRFKEFELFWTKLPEEESK
jgi:hypothetical protein